MYFTKILSRMCLKNTFYKRCITICGRFRLNEDGVTGYINGWKVIIIFKIYIIYRITINSYSKSKSPCSIRYFIEKSLGFLLLSNFIFILSSFSSRIVPLPIFLCTTLFPFWNFFLS